MKDEDSEEFKNMVDIARKDVEEIVDHFNLKIEDYFKSDSPVENNQKFLVVSRAVNCVGLMWAEHFWLNFNPVVANPKKVDEV